MSIKTKLNKTIVLSSLLMSVLASFSTTSAALNLGEVLKDVAQKQIEQQNGQTHTTPSPLTDTQNPNTAPTANAVSTELLKNPKPVLIGEALVEKKKLP